jgi:multiple sugar transport system permease protein
LLLLPSAVIIGIFGFWPLIDALHLSLHQWRGGPGPFVGGANYQLALAGEPGFWKAVQVTIWYVIGTVPPTIAIGYLVAELLQARIRGLGFYRTLFFLPYVVSPVAAAAVWRWILNPNFGVANALLAPLGQRSRWLYEEEGVVRLAAQALHLGVPDWAAGPSLALACIAGVSVWHSLGFAVVVLTAGLAGIPLEVVEAARLDGARGWSLLRGIKLPLLSPTLFFLTIVFTIRAFQVYGDILILSSDFRGGPNDSTRNITLYIVQSFNENTARLGPGYGAAVSMLLFAAILVLTLLQFRLLGRRVHYR